MTYEEYLSNMKPGYIVDAGSEEHLVMHELSQRALKITMELNNKYGIGPVHIEICFDAVSNVERNVP